MVWQQLRVEQGVSAGHPASTVSTVSTVSTASTVSTVSIVLRNALFADLLAEALHEWERCDTVQVLPSVTHFAHTIDQDDQQHVLITDTLALDSEESTILDQHAQGRASRLAIIVVCTSTGLGARFAQMTRRFGHRWGLVDGTNCTLDQLVLAMESDCSGFTTFDSSRMGQDLGSVELTEQEQTVWMHVAKGASNVAVAEALKTSEKTVERALRSLYRKLGLTGSSGQVNPRVAASLSYHGF